MLITVTSATAEPVTREEVKQHLRIESTQEDYLIDGMISAARIQAENYMKRTVMPCQYRLVMEDFPTATAVLELPMPPLSSSATDVTVTYYKDTTILNDSTTVNATVYAVETSGVPYGRVYPVYGNEWPDDVTDEKKDAVQITYTAGYPTRASVPEPIKQWIKMKVGQMYELREGFSMRDYNPNRLEHEFFNGLLDPYVVIRVI